MLTINDNIYRQLAQLVLEAIGNNDYFNGTIEYDTDEFYSTLYVTLIIYREPLDDPTDMTHNATRIRDIVPIWWEYKVIQANGPVMNDFSWREFRDYLL